ncbi:sigma-70 family RNA polymerase sigma factor [Acidipila sp. EB88]|nr:sigma-70 family RNA polymerase sigma factor [Acidipila sp. EB88]
MVARLLVRLLGTQEGVQDLAQECFLRLFRGLEGFRGEAQVRTYLYRIVVNVAHDARRQRAQQQRRTVSLSEPLDAVADQDGFCWEDRLAHGGANAEQQLQEREFQQAVEAAMAQLSEPERAVLVLYHQEEQSYQEIAAALALPINTVRTHLHRARSRLRGLLQVEGKGVRV